MTKTCGECLLFHGPGQKCGSGQIVTGAYNYALSVCFKGPASLFKNKVCGGCKLYQGSGQKCEGGKIVTSANNSAIDTCYSPTPTPA